MPTVLCLVQACLAACLSGGLALICSPSMCFIEDLFRGSSLKLTDEAVEYSQPVPSACVLGKTKRTVGKEQLLQSVAQTESGQWMQIGAPSLSLTVRMMQVRLENITDVTVEDNCLLRMFGLKV